MKEGIRRVARKGISLSNLIKSYYTNSNAYVKTKQSNTYRDPEIFKQEYQKLFYPSWQYFCSLSQIPNPGNYFSRMLLNIPIFAIRGKDNSIKVFHNVCRHRGSLILPEEGCSKIDVLRCGYHGWCYNHNGNLVSAPFFDKKEFDYSQMSLKQVDFRIFHDQVFICLKNEQSRDISSQLESVDQELKKIEFEKNFVFAKEYFHPVNNFNWKLLIENNLETSHLDFVHQSSFIQHWESQKIDKILFNQDLDKHTCDIQVCSKSKPLDGHWFYLLPNQLINFYEEFMSWERMYPVEINTCQSPLDPSLQNTLRSLPSHH